MGQRGIRLGVAGGHVGAAATEDETRLFQGHAIPQHLCGRCVTQQVRPFGGSFYVGALESVFHHGRDAISGSKGSARGIASNKHMIGSDVRGPAFHIAEQRVAYILRKRQSHLVSPFPHHLQRAAVPVDVREAQMGYVSSPQSQPRQHQHDCPVTKPPGICAITCGHQPVYFFR